MSVKTFTLREEREQEFVLLDQHQSDKICFEDYLYILEHPKEWTFKKFLDTYHSSWNCFQKNVFKDEIEDRMRTKREFNQINITNLPSDDETEEVSEEDYWSPPEDLIEDWEGSGDEF